MVLPGLNWEVTRVIYSSDLNLSWTNLGKSITSNRRRWWSQMVLYPCKHMKCILGDNILIMKEDFIHVCVYEDVCLSYLVTIKKLLRKQVRGRDGSVWGEIPVHEQLRLFFCGLWWEEPKKRDLMENPDFVLAGKQRDKMHPSKGHFWWLLFPPETSF